MLFVVCAGCCLLGLRLGCFGVVVVVCFRCLLGLLLALRFRFCLIVGFGGLWVCDFGGVFCLDLRVSGLG